MRKFVALSVALAVGAASAAASAGTGQAFVNANLGSSNYNIPTPAPTPGYDSYQDNYAPAGALRVGYRWNSVVDYGFEVGYGYLGVARTKIFDATDGTRLEQKNRGWLLGGNLNYNITEHWYVDARLGWYRGRNEYALSVIPAGTYAARGSYTATGEYFGLGAGYNFNQHFSLGLAYDNYHTPGDTLRSNDPYVNGTPVRGTRIGMYSLQAEYRF